MLRSTDSDLTKHQWLPHCRAHGQFSTAYLHSTHSLLLETLCSFQHSSHFPLASVTGLSPFSIFFSDQWYQNTRVLHPSFLFCLKSHPVWHQPVQWLQMSSLSQWLSSLQLHPWLTLWTPVSQVQSPISPLSMVETGIPHLPKTELWPHLQTAPPTVLLISTLFSSQTLTSFWLFLFVFEHATSKSHWIYPQNIFRMQQFLPTSAASCLVWPRLTWIIAVASHLVSQFSHLPQQSIPNRAARGLLWKSQLHPITILLESIQWFLKSCRIKSKLVIKNHVLSCHYLSDLIFLLSVVVSIVILEYAQYTLDSGSLCCYFLCLKWPFTRYPHGLFLFFILVPAWKSSFKRWFPWSSYPI